MRTPLVLIGALIVINTGAASIAFAEWKCDGYSPRVARQIISAGDVTLVGTILSPMSQDLDRLRKTVRINEILIQNNAVSLDENEKITVLLDTAVYGPSDAFEVGSRQIFTLRQSDRSSAPTPNPVYSLHSLAPISCLDKEKQVIARIKNGDR
jgi:hypothetical protein